MSRVIQGLLWAKALSAKPACIPNGRARGAKAAGLRYERALAKALPSAKYGQWWEYEDVLGHGYCQTDLTLTVSGGTLILESKYSWVPEGHTQVELLYMPVVALATGKPAFGGVVTKRLKPGMPPLVIARSLGEFAAAAVARRRVVLHWIGTGALEWTGPRPLSFASRNGPVDISPRPL